MRLLVVYVVDLYRFAKIKFLLNLLLMVVLGMLEGIGILMIIPLLVLAGIVPGGQATSGITFWVKHVFQYIGMPLNLPVVLVIYTAVNLGQSWLKRYQSVLNVDIQQSFNTYLGIKLFRLVAYARWQFLMSIAKSDITNIFLMELNRVYMGISYFLRMVAAGLINLIQLILAFMIAPGLTGLVLGGALVLFMVLRPLFRYSRKIGEDISHFNSDLMSDLTEHLNGLKEVKCYGIESTQIENFAKIRNTLRENMVSSVKIQSQTSMYYNIGAAVFISLCLFSALEVFKLNTQQFIMISYISARLWPGLSSLQTTLQNIIIMIPAFKAVKQLEDQCLAARENMSEENAGARIGLNRGVEFRNVLFHYDAERSDAGVKEADFFLPAGSTTAFVGVSGAGKSTLIDLLTGLLTPNAGDILVDGEPLAENLPAWRKSLGYVPQDPLLFNASIRDNLLWASPDASEKEMWEVLSLASADSFVRNLSDGLDTVVGDRGVRLSGGERQRIVLARALLRKPSILVLDEATSALDSENEGRIKSAIDGLRGKLTIVVIAHRISTIKNADRIFVLEEGRIVEQGTYQTLMDNRDSRFYSLAS